MKSKLLFLLFTLWSIRVYADEVRGRILDEQGSAMVGAAITVQNMTNIGVTTDANGAFVINVPDVQKNVLMVSYIGYKTKYVAINGRTSIDIQLQQDASMLDEVVFVGYGSMRKSDLTGSVASIKASDMEASVSTSFDKLLQGKAAGLVVTSGSGAPGASVNVRIRGTNSLRGDNTPLYVIDGVVMSGLADTSNPMRGGGGTSRVEPQDPLSFISPQDIASIEILKDASATAIYGSQGANGVIMITTKRGESSKPSVMISATTTLSTLAKKIPVMGLDEYANFRRDLGDEEFSLEGLTAADWQDEATRLATSQSYRASISGKSNQTRYFWALGYSNQEGVIRQTNIQKYDTRLNLEQQIGKYVSLKSNTLFSTATSSMTSGADSFSSVHQSVVRHMISYHPYRGIADSGYTEFDEEHASIEGWFTDYDDDAETNMFNTSITLDVKPLKWLTWRTSANMIYKTNERSMWFGPLTFNGASNNGKAGMTTSNRRIYNIETMLMFNHTFNKRHTINGTLGVVHNKSSVKNTGITATDFFSYDLRADGISQAANQYPFLLTKTGTQLFSVLARGVYNYDERYIATATFRADGSSKFSKSNRFSYFPSFALAWRMNQESWLRDVKAISNLKIRLGWGQVGNQAVAPYQVMASYSNKIGAKPDNSSEPGLVPNNIPNPNLKWETSEQWNVGLDLGLFHSRLNLSIDAYHKTTKDLLQKILIPYSSGFDSMWINNGKIRNRGIEISLQGTPIQKENWELNLGGNITFARSKIIDLGIRPSDFGMMHGVSGYWGADLGGGNFMKFPANAFIVGHSVGLFMGYQTNGIMQEEQYNSPEYQEHPVKMQGKPIMPGDINYIDQNGDFVVDDRDRVIIGNPNPDFTFAFNASLRYKKLTLDMGFIGAVGHDIVNANLINECDVKDYQRNIRRDAYRQAWTPEKKSNIYPRLGYFLKGVMDDRIVEDGSYLKMSNLSLSYRFDFKKSKLIKNLTLNFTGSNLFTITSYSGYDPDVNTFVNDTDRLGVDLVSYPSMRSFSFGIIANF